MYNKEIILNDKKFVFMFTHEPYYTDESTIVMGFPYNMEAEKFDSSKIDNIKGYYTFIKFHTDYVEIINDVMANYRTYYMEKDGVVYFSNDFLKLFNILPKDDREPNKFEIKYWYQHRYTTGGETICKKIHKIKPAHMYKFYSDKVEEKTYFKDLKNKPNRKQNFEEVLSDLRNTISLIKKMPQKKFLLFSGGADSTLCVKLLQEQGVEFTPVFAKQIPTNSMNYDDSLKVRYSANLLGIEPIEIEVDTTIPIEESVLDIMIQDQNITQIFFEVAKQLKQKYGEDIILMNGQGADSIIGFGPTNYGVRHSMVRSMLYNYYPILNHINYEIFKLFRPLFRNYRLPHKNEYLRGFINEKLYVPLIELNYNEDYHNHLQAIVDFYKQYFKNYDSLRMYLKIYCSDLQGANNYANVQNCEFYGIKSLFLYGTQNIIYSTIQNTDYKYEILHPKSVVYKILKDVFNYTMPNIKKKKNYKKEIKQEKTFRQYENEIYQIFYGKLYSLEFSEDIKL